MSALVMSLRAFSQFVPEHISNSDIYLFIDELASEGIISVNSAIKPYSKAYIGQKLQEAEQKRTALNKRQSGELTFYEKTYRPERTEPDTLRWREPLNIFKKQQHLATSLNPTGIIYKDQLFTFVASPIYGFDYRTNENGNVYHTFGGLEAHASIGKLVLYGSLRDNHESELMARPGYFTQETGGAFKENNGGRKGGDYSEMRGGITYEWKWGDVGLVKDHFVWGDNNHGSNIFSGRTPSFAHIRLHLHPAKWIDFNYIHGWLVSEVTDSSRSYYNNGQYKAVMKQKYIAANMLTIIPFKNLYISLGNSIVYSDMGGVHPAYLIPMAFYKSMDHTLTHGVDNQNSQMFFTISSRQIKHLHLYLSSFIDEFSVTRLKNKTSHNFISWKGGFDLSNFPIRNIRLAAEFTQTTPITYKHDIPAVTFESNQYNLGHYLRDNSREIYVALSYKPIARLSLTGEYTFAEHGNEYAYIRVPEIADRPMLTDITWKSTALEFMASFQLLNNTGIWISYENRSVTGADVDGLSSQQYLDMFTPAFYQGNTHTISFGFHLGF